MQIENKVHVLNKKELKLNNYIWQLDKSSQAVACIYREVHVHTFQKYQLNHPKTHDQSTCTYTCTYTCTCR